MVKITSMNLDEHFEILNTKWNQNKKHMKPCMQGYHYAKSKKLSLHTYNMPLMTVKLWIKPAIRSTQPFLQKPFGFNIQRTKGIFSCFSSVIH